MFEVTLLFLMMLCLAACAFLPMGYGLLFSTKAHRQSDASSGFCPNTELRSSDDSVTHRSFLMYLETEIESALWPRPTDSVLQRHYDTLVSVELENRLATMPDS